MNEYVIAFSSFYKAVYAQEKLQESRIRSTLKKLPVDLMHSCGYALYIKTNFLPVVMEALAKSRIDNRGVYLVETVNNQISLRPVI